MAIYYNSASLGITETHTLKEFIDTGNAASDNSDYKSISYYETRDGFEFVVKNLLDDYLTDLKEQCILIELTPQEVNKYKYNPKMLSYKIYGSTKLFYTILRLNNICSTHEFTIPNKKLYLLPKNTLSNAISIIYNKESMAMNTYNQKHSKDKIITPVNKFISKSYSSTASIGSSSTSSS